MSNLKSVCDWADLYNTWVSAERCSGSLRSNRYRRLLAASFLDRLPLGTVLLARRDRLRGAAVYPVGLSHCDMDG